MLRLCFQILVPKINVFTIVTILLCVFEATYQGFFADTHIYRRKWSMNLNPLKHLGQNPFYKTYLPISDWPLNTEILDSATLGTSSLLRLTKLIICAQWQIVLSKEYNKSSKNTSTWYTGKKTLIYYWEFTNSPLCHVHLLGAQSFKQILIT